MTKAIIPVCLLLCAAAAVCLQVGRDEGRDQEETRARAPSRQPVIGMNLSGAEYSWSSFATHTDLDFLKVNGITLLRIPISWEKAQRILNGPLSSSYIAGLEELLVAASQRRMHVIVDVHNYGRYNSSWATAGNTGPGKGDIIGSAAVPVSAYANLWTRLAAALKGTPGLAYYDIMNEPHNMGGKTVWPRAAQAAVNAIRAVDTNTEILVEGDGWASASKWEVNNADLAIADPADKLLYEAHCYFDDGSSRYLLSYAEQGASPNRGVELVQPFLSWLSERHARGFLGEFAVPGNDPRWLAVLNSFLNAIQAAGVSGTYWVYVSHLSTDPPWWPVANSAFIRSDNGQANPQLPVLTNHNAATRW